MKPCVDCGNGVGSKIDGRCPKCSEIYLEENYDDSGEVGPANAYELGDDDYNWRITWG